jgi:hypothetical protein
MTAQNLVLLSVNDTRSYLTSVSFQAEQATASVLYYSLNGGDISSLDGISLAVASHFSPRFKTLLPVKWDKDLVKYVYDRKKADKVLESLSLVFNNFDFDELIEAVEVLELTVADLKKEADLKADTEEGKAEQAIKDQAKLVNYIGKAVKADKTALIKALFANGVQASDLDDYLKSVLGA